MTTKLTTSKTPRGRRTAGLATAVAGALIIWVVADPIAGADLTTGSGASAQAVGPAAVALVPLLAGLAAIGLAVLISRSGAGRPRRIWTGIALAVLLVSLAGPLDARTVGGGLSLAAMHLVVGTVLILGLRPTVPERAGNEP